MNAIKKACNDTGVCYIFNCPGGQQWISNGSAAWPVEGIVIREESIPALFDLSPKKRAEMVIKEMETDDPRFVLTPMAEDEALRDLGIVLSGGEEIKVLLGKDGIMMVKAGLLKPASRGDGAALFARALEGRVPVVAVYGDMLVSGLIWPITGKAAREILNRLEEMASYPVRKTAAEAEEEEPDMEQVEM